KNIDADRKTANDAVLDMKFSASLSDPASTADACPLDHSKISEDNLVRRLCIVSDAGNLGMNTIRCREGYTSQHVYPGRIVNARSYCNHRTAGVSSGHAVAKFRQADAGEPPHVVESAPFVETKTVSSRLTCARTRMDPVRIAREIA